MKIAYFGNIINHGIPLAAWGTGFLISLSTLPGVESVEIFCPEKDKVEQPVRYPPNFIIHPIIKYDKPFSILGVLKSIRFSNFDVIVFNLNATSLGDKNLLNLLALVTPWIVSKVLRIKTLLIYHSSTLTTDVKKLGYNSLYDQIRMSLVKSIESMLFVSVDTYFLLKLYKTRLDSKLKRNKVHSLDLSYVEPMPTLFFNFADTIPRLITKERGYAYPTVLLHGFWGPQKNLDLALEVLSSVRKEGFAFKVILSGAINPHFGGYRSHFEALINKYDALIDEFKGFVYERDILNLFLEADLLLLPYKVAGGHSGVLEIGFFFETSIIGITHPEYEEKMALMNNYLKLVDEENFCNAVRDFITNWNAIPKASILVDAKLNLLQKRIRDLFDFPQ